MLGSQVESTAVVSFLEEAGPRMCKLWLTYSSQTTAILGALLVGWRQVGAEPDAAPGQPGHWPCVLFHLCRAAAAPSSGSWR